jgi:hypothetical protein
MLIYDPGLLRAWRQDKGINVDVKWVTIAPGGKFFLPEMGARAAEYYMVLFRRAIYLPFGRKQ